MADPTDNDGALTDAALKDAQKLAAAARDRGMEQLEGAKGQLAEGAERVASAVERAADELEGEGDDSISGYGRSLANLMRQLAGGLRERDIEQFASELGSLARRNPGMFLAGSVALGFGVARFFKARAPRRPATDGYDYEWRGESAGEWRGEGTSEWRGEGAGSSREDFDPDESLDLSAGSASTRRSEDDSAGGTSRAGVTEQWASSGTQASGTQDSAARADERQTKPRSGGKGKAKGQRASAGGNPKTDEGPSSPQRDAAGSEGSTAGADSAFTGGTGGGALRGGKEP
jgi:hypothetical protein